MFVRFQRNGLIVFCIFGLLGNLSCWDLPPFIQETDDDTSPDSGDVVDYNSVAMMACPKDQCLITGTIADNQHWTANNQYILRGTVLVGDGKRETRLTIEPGTHIYGERPTSGMLVVMRHSKLYAEGTADDPIVFSSDRPVGERRRGDWGGVVINGNAPVNGCEDKDPCVLYGQSGTGWYGGGDRADDSGVLRYVRIEYAGKELGPSRDLGGLTLRGVGSGTTLSQLHVHLNQYDGISLSGGSVDLKYVLATGNGDDGFAWSGGWQGRAQYVVGQHYEDAGDNGFEGLNHPNQYDMVPVSAPTIYNATLVGSPGSEHSGIGLLLTAGTGGEFRNVLAVGFGDACLDINDSSTWERVDAGELSFKDSIIDCETPFKENKEGIDPASVSLDGFFFSDANNHCTPAQLISPFSRLSPNFSPGTDSPALEGVVTPADNFFDGVSFVGGIDPEDDWTRQNWMGADILARRQSTIITEC